MLFYRKTNDEVEIFSAANTAKLPILLKGPTGCGKTRFVEWMASQNNKSTVTVSCNEDTSAADLLGRFLIVGGDTIWQDGPVTKAVKTGSFLYLDEVAEAREDVIVVLHSLCDYRREIHIDRLNQTIKAVDGFQLVVSFNPGYQGGLKDLKPSTRQRFVSILFNYPSVEVEMEIIIAESGCDLDIARKLCQLAQQIRSLDQLTLRETVSTRLLIHAATLIKFGLPERLACNVAIVNTLSDDIETTKALADLCTLRF